MGDVLLSFVREEGGFEWRERVVVREGLRRLVVEVL